MKKDMERTTTMKSFDCNLPPKSPILRDGDASFSSYLISQKPNTSQPNNNHNQHRTIDDPTSELSIFDAHKYFNEVTNNDNIQKVTISSNNSNSNNNNSRVSPVVININNETESIGIPESTRYSSASSSVDGYANIRNYRARSFHAATPTASSEASWNSQQGLLSHPPGAISVNIKHPSNPNSNNNNNNKNNLRSSLSKPIWLLRRKCPCTGKKSVQVNEKKSTELPKNSTKNPSPVSPSPPPPPPMNNWVNNNNSMDQNQTPNHVVTKSQRFQPVVTTTVRVPFTEGFTFPVLNPNSISTTTKHKNGVALEEPPRESLEVFRPPDEHTVEAIHAKSLNFPFLPAMSRIVVDDGDAASDASSDLFEIESFSTATQSSSYAAAVYRRNSRDSFDEGSVTTAMTECYEPSEASIEWSVTTADGYDESSIVSGFIGGGGCGAGGGGVTAEQWKRKGGNGLLSCRCEKAVSVGPQPVKCEGAQRGATSAWKQVSGGVISRVGGVNINKPPLARSSHSQRNNNNTPRVTSFAFAT
jgi:hypothetical protein